MNTTNSANSGQVSMVDVSNKDVTLRTAEAFCRIDLQPSTMEQVNAGTINLVAGREMPLADGVGIPALFV